MENFLLELIQNDDVFWTRADNPYSDVILSTRIRLARNYKKYPFPNKMGQEDAQKLLLEVRDSLLDQQDLYFFDLTLLNDELRSALFEKQLISKELVLKKEAAALILNKANDISIMVNEEDHLRIQTYASGLDLEQALSLAIQKDDFFASLDEYAFDKELGFITSCPTNIGTGLRASVMVHLPALTELNRLPALAQELQKAGYALRGMYGEGTESWGGFFQVSNQLTTGISEEDIVFRINHAAQSIARQERQARQEILAEKRLFLEDRVYRALGTLTNARIISKKEAILNISILRFGICAGIIDIDLSLANKLILHSSPARLKISGLSRGEKLRGSLRDVEI